MCAIDPCLRYARFDGANAKKIGVMLPEYRKVEYGEWSEDFFATNFFGCRHSTMHRKHQDAVRFYALGHASVHHIARLSKFSFNVPKN